MRVLAVRHGQASFDAADYDQLSALGEQQSLALGNWLLRHDERFDRVVTGRLRRHAQSLSAIRERYSAAGHDLPEAEIEPGFDEFDHRRVLSAFIALQPTHSSVLASDGGRRRDDPLAVFNLLRAALQCWARGELDALAEPWSAFKQRTRSALQRLSDSSSGQSVLLVSSGGVIAQLAAAVLEAPDHRAIELNLSMRNSALTELQGLPGDLRLASWNTVPHLAEQRAMWTYL